MIYGLLTKPSTTVGLVLRCGEKERQLLSQSTKELLGYWSFSDNADLTYVNIYSKDNVSYLLNKLGYKSQIKSMEAKV